jgi:hypothetical protein
MDTGTDTDTTRSTIRSRRRHCNSLHGDIPDHNDESRGVEWCGVEWCEVEWSGVKWSGVETEGCRIEN